MSTAERPEQRRRAGHLAIDTPLVAAVSPTRQKSCATFETAPSGRHPVPAPHRVRAAILAGLEFLELDPVFAKVVTADIYVAGGDALTRRDEALGSTQRLIGEAPGYEVLGIPPAAEAIQAGIYAMLPRRVRSGDSRGLRTIAPIATYSALLPFLGAEAAWTVACGRTAPEPT